MSTATRWYATREAVKNAGQIKGSSLDPTLDRLIEAASTDVEEQLKHRFISYLDTRRFNYPPSRKAADVYYVWPYGLFLDEDLLEATLVTKDGDLETTIAPADYFLLPDSEDQKREIEINLTSGNYLGPAVSSSAGAQDAIRITGEWGYSRSTKAAGALAAAALIGDVTIRIPDSSLVGIGDTLRIDNERLFVSGRRLEATGATLTADVAGNDAHRTIPVDDATLIHAGELITIGAERLYVEAISGNNLIALRAEDASQLEAHLDNDVVMAPRLLEVVRGINGSAAAAHLIAASVLKYAPPGDIVELTIANVLLHHEFGKTGWTGKWGGGEAAQEMKGSAVYFLCESAKRKYLEGGVA
jgi:hypothetical protein